MTVIYTWRFMLSWPSLEHRKAAWCDVSIAAVGRVGYLVFIAVLFDVPQDGIYLLVALPPIPRAECESCTQKERPESGGMYSYSCSVPESA